MPLLEKIAHISVPRKVMRAGYPEKHLGVKSSESVGSNAYLSFGLTRMWGLACTYIWLQLCMRGNIKGLLQHSTICTVRHWIMTMTRGYLDKVVGAPKCWLECWSGPTSTPTTVDRSRLVSCGRRGAFILEIDIVLMSPAPLLTSCYSTTVCLSWFTP